MMLFGRNTRRKNSPIPYCCTYTRPCWHPGTHGRPKQRDGEGWGVLKGINTSPWGRGTHHGVTSIRNTFSYSLSYPNYNGRLHRCLRRARRHRADRDPHQLRGWWKRQQPECLHHRIDGRFSNAHFLVVIDSCLLPGFASPSYRAAWSPTHVDHAACIDVPIRSSSYLSHNYCIIRISGVCRMGRLYQLGL